MARKGLLSDEDASLVLTLPVSFKTLMDVFQRNQRAMLKEFATDKGIPFHIEAIQLYQEQFPNPDQFQLVVFDDEKSQEEIVYGIIVNTYTKSTFLTFRGSVSKRDYKADMDISMRTFRDDHGRTVRTQRGFSDYLFGTEEELAVKSRDGIPPTKFERIVRTLKEQYELHPDHELCVTGHSLGGSLALLAAAALAMDATIKPLLKNSGPIRVIGFGSMLVGDLRFLRTFQRLERQNLIRSTVIINQGDLIPLLPFSSGWRFYRVLGKRVIISDGRRKPVIYSPPEALRICCNDAISVPGFILPRLCFIFLFQRKFWSKHTVDATTRNIFGSRKYLEELSVDSLYVCKQLLPCTIH
ncbi:lipase class 3 [Nitzschia inconspicua]|uniref:Lipase class 3 n=1 Tax=Nitzschia inconspicua TaxID=303405 RepID=A0A9K3M7G5_9STRA|nr:lipase class 3 [Nitzschia inconspicua]